MVKTYEDYEAMGVFDRNTLRLIARAIDAGRDPSVWAKPGVDPRFMRDAYLLQSKGYDPSPLMSAEFDLYQHSYLESAIREGLDATKIAYPEYDSRQMRFLISTMREGADPSYFAKPGMSMKEMTNSYALYRMGPAYLSDDERQQRARSLTEQYRRTGKYSERKLYQIYLALYEGLDITPYADAAYRSEQLNQIRCGLKDGVDVSVYANPKFSYGRMNIIRSALKEGYDTSVFTDLRYSPEQVRVLYRAMKAGVDYSAIADPSISACRMETMISKLKAKATVEDKTQAGEAEVNGPKNLSAF